MSEFYTNNPLRNAGAFTTHDPTIPQGISEYYGILKRWTGAAWVKAKLLVYISGQWIAKKLYRYDQTWKEVDATG